MSRISIQNAKIFGNINLRWFIIHIYTNVSLKSCGKTFGCLKKALIGYISIQNANIFENIHLRWFIICIRIGKRKKKPLFFNSKFLIEENR